MRVHVIPFFESEMQVQMKIWHTQYLSSVSGYRGHIRPPLNATIRLEKF